MRFFFQDLFLQWVLFLFFGRVFVRKGFCFGFLAKSCVLFVFLHVAFLLQEVLFLLFAKVFL